MKSPHEASNSKCICRNRNAFIGLILLIAIGGGWTVFKHLRSGGGSQTAAADQNAIAGAVTVIQAKDGSAGGKWTCVQDTLASGGTYMSAGAAGVGTSLDFSINVDKPAQIAVTPVWFIHGDQHKARRFPDTSPHFYVQQTWPLTSAWDDINPPDNLPAPVISKPGPDAIDVSGATAYFSAPAGGKVGIADLKSEKVTGCINVGGYVSDLAVDKDRNELLVADAARNLITVFDLKDRKKLADIPVPALPWSIVLHQGRLFVASMAARKVAVVDVAARKVIGGIDLPVGPQNVCVTAGEHPQLIVRLLPMVWDAKTFKEVPADRMTYWPWNGYGDAASGEEEKALKAAAVTHPKALLKSFFYGRKPIAFTLDAGPSRAWCRSSYTSSPLPSKLFLVDPNSRSITVIPVGGGKPHEIAFDAAPVAMDLLDLNLYVLCKGECKVRVIDVVGEKVVRTVEAPYAADHLFAGCLVPRHTTAEQLSSTAVIAGELPGRLALGFHPLAFDPQTLAPAPAPDLPFLPLARHCNAAAPEAQGKQLFVDNLHTIQVDRKRWIDTSAVTDCHLAGDPAALMPGDQPGAITLRMDDGPECDWENDVWFTPDQRILMVRGTAEFDLHNAVRFTLAPGKHVLKVKAHSRYANLEALRIRRVLDDAVDVQIQPLPQDVHGNVPQGCYGGVFAASEPVSFNLKLAGKIDRPLNLSGAWEVWDYQGKTVLEGKDSFALGAGAAISRPLTLELKETGRFTFHLKLSSPQGEREVLHRFVKLPPLDYPRLICRHDETGQIADRVARYPRLFQRYREYLLRHSSKADYLPQAMRSSGWGNDMTRENRRWRALCMEFADLFLESPGKPKYQDMLAPLLSRAGGYVAWQSDYEFGGAQTILNDLMMSTSQAARQNLASGYAKGNRYITDAQVDGNVFWDYFLTIKEPLKPRDRVVIDQVAREFNNYDRYFAAHAGSRGGNWFQGTQCMCRCPIHSMTRSFLWARNFFGEKHFMERTNIGGLLTLQSYAYPRYDTHAFLPSSGYRETMDPVNNTQAMRWALSGLSRLPLEKTYYKEVFDCIQKLNGPMTDEVRQVDALLEPGSRVVIPFYLAMGWVDPDLEGVQWEEMPPSMIFDGEGAVCMKSGWDKNMTDIYFVSGLKDISYRNLPNHFQVFKAGEMVVGTGRPADHGCPVPLYGNSVRIGEDERFGGYLAMGWAYDRMDERFVADCFTTLGYTYTFRDWRLTGYRTEAAYWEGGGHPHAFPREMPMHSHTGHPFIQEGRILAYETFPAFDYVVGDATNSLPIEQVREAYRQMVFIRPDVLVIYDRLALGDPPKSVKWPLMTLRNKTNPKGNPQVTGGQFTSTNGVASLWGQALLPKGGKINSATCYVPLAKDVPGDAIPMNTGTFGVEDWPTSVGYLEIETQTGSMLGPGRAASMGESGRTAMKEPLGKSRSPEFLVVLRVGLAQPARLDCTLLEDRADSSQVGIAFAYDGKTYTIYFNRQGHAPGGDIKIDDGAKTILEHSFAEKVRDTYGNWKGTEHFEKWMHQDRFKAYITESDRRQFGAAR